MTYNKTLLNSIHKPLKKAQGGGSMIEGRPTLKQISQMPAKRYEPSDAVKKTKAALAAASIASGPFSIFPGAASAAYDMGTAARYAMDGQWEKAGQDALQAGISMIPTAGVMAALTGMAGLAKANKAMRGVRAMKTGSDLVDMAEPVSTIYNKATGRVQEFNRAGKEIGSMRPRSAAEVKEYNQNLPRQIKTGATPEGPAELMPFMSPKYGMGGVKMQSGGTKGKKAVANPYKPVDASSANTFRNWLPVPDNIAQLAAKQVYGDARMNNESLEDKQKVLLWNVIQNARARTGSANSGTEYEDYGNLGYGKPEEFANWFNKGKLDFFDTVGKSITNPGFKLASTIGRGRYWQDEKDPDTFYYTDVYDWNPGEKNFSGKNIYQNIRNYVRGTEDKNLNADKNEKYRMNFKLTRAEIEKIKKEQEDSWFENGGSYAKGGMPCFECGGMYADGGYYDCPDQEKDPETGKCKAEVVRGKEAAAANKAAGADLNAWAKQVAAMDKMNAKQDAAQYAGQLSYDYDWMQSPVEKAEKKAAMAASKQFFQQNPKTFVPDDTSGFSPEQKYIIASKLKQKVSTPMGAKAFKQQFNQDPGFFDLGRLQSDIVPTMGGWSGIRNWMFNNKADGGIIEDPRGQWAYPGAVTRIPGSSITMEGVNYPVLGIGSNGIEEMMEPGGAYDFGDADYVDEFPVMAGGGLLSETVTCSNCGWSWKAVDGGYDPLTCHKCGGTVKMENGGQHGGLDRWFAEKWVDVKTGKACGRQEGEKRRSYPACRPSRRVSEDTPKTSGELSSSEREKFKREKTSSERINYQHRRKEDGGEINETDMANKPNNPALWSRAKSMAKEKFDVYPSAYANGWAAKYYKSKGGTWRKAEYGGMPVPYMAEGGEPQNAGFNALPEAVQQKILSNMAEGGKMPADIARARFAAAGNEDKLADYGYAAYGGMMMPVLAAGGEANGEMAMGQMAAVADKMSKLLKFVKPDENLDPWIASKLAVMDHSADAINDYLMYGPEGEQEEMEQMANGGYTVTRSNDRKGKTHKVTGPDGTVKYFGDSKLGQHPKDPERKAAFYARHKKNLANNPFFRAFARKTWADGGMIEQYKNGGSTWAAPNFYQRGGPVAGDEMDVTPAQLKMLRDQGYQIEILD